MGRPNKKQHYLDNDELTAEILKCKESRVASDKLGEMFILIVNNVARSFYWANPDDGQDCISTALYDMCKNFWKFEPVDANGKPFNAFAFCSQMAYFGLAGAWRVLYPKKYDGTVSLTCLDENGKHYDMSTL